MSRKKRLGWLRSPAILFVVFVTVLGLSGLVYAFWFTSLTSEGYVNTGNVLMTWGDIGTDDDGILANDPSGTDCDDEGNLDNGDPCPDEAWDNFVPGAGGSDDPGSSADPSSGLATSRYDKDVARCEAYDSEDGGSGIMTWITNAYPSYYCTTYATAFNEGSIPVKAIAPEMSFQVWVPEPEACTSSTGNGDDILIPICSDGAGSWQDLVFDVDPSSGTFGAGEGTGHDGQPEWQLNGQITDGIVCGTQIDPGDGVKAAGWIHVNNPANQSTLYRWSLVQTFVNWNEYNDDMCDGFILEDGDSS